MSINKALAVTVADYDKELISGFVRVIEKTLFGECKESEIGIDELFYNGEPSDFTSKLSALNFDAYGFVLVMAGECASSALKKPDDAVVRATQYVLEYIISELEKCLGDNTQRKLHVILCAKDDGLPAVFTIGKAVLTPKNLIYDKLTYIDRKITSYPSAMLIALKAIKKRESILGKNVLNRLIHNSAVQNPVTILLYAREIAFTDCLSDEKPFLYNFNYNLFYAYPEYDAKDDNSEKFSEYQRMMRNTVLAPLIRIAAKKDYQPAQLIMLCAGEGTLEMINDIIESENSYKLWKVINYNSFMLSENDSNDFYQSKDILYAEINLLRRFLPCELYDICCRLDGKKKGTHIDLNATLIFELEFYMSTHGIKDDEFYFYNILKESIDNSDIMADRLASALLSSDCNFFNPERAAQYMLLPREEFPPMYSVMYILAEKFHSGEEKLFKQNIPLAVKLYNAALDGYYEMGCLKALDALVQYFSEGGSIVNYKTVYRNIIKNARRDDPKAYRKYPSILKKLAEKNKGTDESEDAQ